MNLNSLVIIPWHRAVLLDPIPEPLNNAKMAEAAKGLNNCFFCAFAIFAFMTPGWLNVVAQEFQSPLINKVVNFSERCISEACLPSNLDFF